MKVLVACEFSGIVRDAFIARGHDAISCDLLPTERPGPHIQGDIRDVDLSLFDLKIAHPPCTRLCISGNRWRSQFPGETEEAIAFFLWFVEHGFNCIENPVGIMSTLYRKPDTVIQPWQFGHPVNKKTCLWLKEVPVLLPTEVCSYSYNTIHEMGPSKDRGKNRSITFKGIANAMAMQWG